MLYPRRPPVRAEDDGPDRAARVRRLDWSTLLKRTFLVDVLTCPRCSSRMEIVAVIDQEATAHKILEHLGLASKPPPPRPPRPPARAPATVDEPSLFD